MVAVGGIHKHLTWQGPICPDLQDTDIDLSGSNLAETAENMAATVFL